MRWLEIIHLRTTPSQIEILLNDLSGLIDTAEQERGFSVLRMYRHPRLPTEVAVHIHWNSQKPKSLESTLGLRLANLLGENGTANHTIWVELMENKGGAGSFPKPVESCMRRKK